VPAEDGVVLERPLGEELVVVELHAGAAELFGDRVGAPLVDVALPLRPVLARQHHVDDRELADVAGVVARHVAEVAARHRDLARQEALVGRLDVAHLLLRQDRGEVDVAVAIEPGAIGRGDDVALAVPMRSFGHGALR
jgi:hypothetical protein